MSDSTIYQLSDYEFKNLSSSRMGTSLDSHIHPLNHNHLEPEVISLSNDSDSKRVSVDSLEGGTSSFGLLEALLLNFNGEVNQVDVSMPHPVLTEEEIQVS